MCAISVFHAFCLVIVRKGIKKKRKTKNILFWICRPTEMILDLEDPDGGKEKLGQICAIFTVQPKNYEDRQEVMLQCTIFSNLVTIVHILILCAMFVTNGQWANSLRLVPRPNSRINDCPACRGLHSNVQQIQCTPNITWSSKNPKYQNYWTRINQSYECSLCSTSGTINDPPPFLCRSLSSIRDCMYLRLAALAASVLLQLSHVDPEPPISVGNIRYG